MVFCFPIVTHHLKILYPKYAIVIFSRKKLQAIYVPYVTTLKCL